MRKVCENQVEDDHGRGRDTCVDGVKSSATETVCAKRFWGILGHAGCCTFVPISGNLAACQWHCASTRVDVVYAKQALLRV
jgi:hypothetical protein